MINALQSLTRWWNERSQRERVMLSGMLVLIAVTALWYGVIQPLRRGVESAAAAKAESAAELAEATTVAGRLDAQRRSVGTRRTASSLENLIATSAAQSGVTLDRHQLDDAAITVWAGATDAKRVFAWLAILQSRHGIGVTDLTAIPGEAGTIQVQATLAGAG